jgi:hypothetical protein
LSNGERRRFDWRPWRWPRWAALTTLFVLGLLVGAAIGVGGAVTETTTLALTETITQTEIVTETTTQTVRQRPAATPSGPGVKVDYGEFDGLFTIHGATLKSSFGTPEVVGQIEYLGGGDCPLDYVDIEGTFFDSQGTILGTGSDLVDSLPEGSRTPFEVSLLDEGGAKRAELIITSATCE